MLALVFIDPYFWVTIPGVLVTVWARLRLNAAYGTYSQVMAARGLTGGDTARLILDRNGMANVEIYPVEGSLSDHYDPTRRAVFLSNEVLTGRSLASVGIAAHEVGHAIQHKNAYALLTLRMSMVGITGLATNAATLAIMVGFGLGMVAARSGLGHWLLLAGVVLYSVTVLFQVVTLPVEYDASARAKAQLIRLGLVTPTEETSVERVLGAAALTYVAAMLTSILQLAHLLLIVRRTRRNDD